jgi:hypothetical protein
MRKLDKLNSEKREKIRKKVKQINKKKEKEDEEKEKQLELELHQAEITKQQEDEYKRLYDPIKRHDCVCGELPHME